MKWFAGLDGGASKTSVRVTDEQGNLVGEGHSGPGSLTVGVEIAADNARVALSQALASSQGEISDCRLVCGLAGHRQDERRRHFETLLSDCGELEVTSDGYAALLGAHSGKAGGIVIVGTGSVGLAMDEDGMCRQVGGWGPVAGDEGSGGWIGQEAVRRTLNAIDEPKIATPVLNDLQRQLGDSHDAILAWLAEANATKFAKLVPYILRHQDDPIVRSILKRAGEFIGRLVRLTSSKQNIPVALMGGLAPTMKSWLPAEPADLLVLPKADSMQGALLRARRLAPEERYS